MTTFPDDMLRLHLGIGTRDVPLTAAKLEWPPPEFLVIDEEGIRPVAGTEPVNAVLKRTSMSDISDEDREEMTNVFRGAVYEYVLEPS